MRLVLVCAVIPPSHSISGNTNIQELYTYAIGRMMPPFRGVELAIAHLHAWFPTLVTVICMHMKICKLV